MDRLYERIYADARFQALQRRRSRLTWALAATIFGAYCTYILVIAFNPALLATPLSAHTVITWGIPIGVAIIVLGFALTGIYVYRANGEFDSTLAAIVERVSAEDRADG